jgi:hypothetical protein
MEMALWVQGFSYCLWFLKNKKKQNFKIIHLTAAVPLSPFSSPSLTSPTVHNSRVWDTYYYCFVLLSSSYLSVFSFSTKKCPTQTTSLSRIYTRFSTNKLSVYSFFYFFLSPTLGTTAATFPDLKFTLEPSALF